MVKTPDQHIPVTPALLHAVARENQTIHQIGDNIQDGIGWEAATDLGFTHPEDAARLSISAEAAQTIAPEVGKRALTIAEMNANERAHIAKARADRRASGF